MMASSMNWTEHESEVHPFDLRTQDNIDALRSGFFLSLPSLFWFAFWSLEMEMRLCV